MLIKKSFVIATGNVDSEGDIIPIGTMKLPEGKPLRIFDHFDASKYLGIVTDIKAQGNTCIATGMFNNDPTGLTPAIGFRAIKFHENEHGGKTYDEIELMCVGLTPAPNADKYVGPIK